MQMVARQFPGLAHLARLNADWMFTVGTVVLCLLAGAFLGSALIGDLPVPQFNP